MINSTNVHVEGFVLIKDALTGEIVLDKKNAIHPEKFSLAIAYTLSHRGYNNFHRIVFGNGGSTVAGTGEITYFPANVTGTDSTIYNQTYAKIIDDQSLLNTNPSQNFMSIVHTPGATYTDIVTQCVLDYNEPSDQEAFDDNSNINNQYVFDELGIMTYPQNGTGNGLLLSHCIFSPIAKALNRKFSITYTIRIYLSQ